MQPRFLRRVGRSPYKLLEHPRLRAGYDFLLLRCASGEIEEELGTWWTSFMSADEEDREILLTRQNTSLAPSTANKKRRRRSNRPRNKTTHPESHS
jgi:poly(A) polymerase